MNDLNLQTNSNHSEIHITDINQSDVADYSCFIGTDATSSNSVHLDVKGIKLFSLSLLLVPYFDMKSRKRYITFRIIIISDLFEIQLR